ncbi:MAG: Hpt domain-containing protein [Planctomycetes bacterium]|nr:Hpt domain-containing protein [Planctomycetota bacterium]
MDTNSHNQRHQPETDRVTLSPPTFSPPPAMREQFLARRRAELETLLRHARAGEWKPVAAVANNVRGTGAMYGFTAIGTAAELLVKAIQDGTDGLEMLDRYVDTVNATHL